MKFRSIYVQFKFVKSDINFNRLRETREQSIKWRTTKNDHVFFLFKNELSKTISDEVEGSFNFSTQTLNISKKAAIDIVRLGPISVTVSRCGCWLNTVPSLSFGIVSAVAVGRLKLFTICVREIDFPVLLCVLVL